MPFVKGSDLKQYKIQKISDREGEFLLVNPEAYYYCELGHLFPEDEQKSEADIVIYSDSEYSFYDPGLWNYATRQLYPKDAYYFIFEHEVRDGLNANEIVKRGDAKYLTKKEFEVFLQRKDVAKLVATKTMITSRDENHKVWDEVMKQRSIETQMILNRLLPEASLSRQIESSLRS